MQNGSKNKSLLFGSSGFSSHCPYKLFRSSFKNTLDNELMATKMYTSRRLLHAMIRLLEAVESKLSFKLHNLFSAGFRRTISQAWYIHVDEVTEVDMRAKDWGLISL
jgi:hypothetical protein